MGLLCELFLADPSDAPHYDDDELDGDEAADMFEIFPFGGLTNLEFELLWAIVEGRPWTPETHSLEVIAEPQEDLNTWIFRFPPRFVSQLAELKAHQVAPFAARWARTEEMHCSSDEAQGALEGLIDVARSAVESGRGLYMWGSL